MWLRARLLSLGVLAWVVSACGGGTPSSPEAGSSSARPAVTPASAEQQPRDARYRFDWRPGLGGEHAFIAEHPLMGLRSELGRGQVLLYPPGAHAGPGLSLRAAAWGCPHVLEDVPAREPKRSPRLDEVRFGDAGAPLVEWYRHRESGLEQGFTVSKLPACAEASGRLLVVLERTPGWSSTVADDHGQATFFRPTGGEVGYSDASARGALGTVHAVQIVAFEDSVALEIDTRGVELPLEIDPLAWTEQQKVVASDGQASDAFGQSVALGGNWLAVGASGDDDTAAGAGAVYVYSRSGTTWGSEQKILASDGAASDTFGGAVALSGNYLAVGAQQDDDGGNNTGSVYVYTHGATWGSEKKVVAPDAQADDRFGSAVALDGTTLLVGAASDDDLGSGAGAAYVFTFNGTNWVFQQKLTASDPGADANDNFGTSVALSGNTAIVGSEFDSDVASSAGAAYVFLRTGTTWAQQQKLVDDAKADDFAGEAVAIDGDTAVIGANDNSDKAVQAGTAWVWTRSGTVWSKQQKLFPKDPVTLDQFGDSVAIRGDVAVIASTGDDSSKGSAYVFTRAAGVWTQTTKLQASDGVANDTYGISLSLDGTTVAIGAIGVSGKGATYLATLTDASTCAVDTDCHSGHCVEGVCCNTACAGTCTSCLASRKASGANGVCGNVKLDTDPRSNCADGLPASGCGLTGVCNGAGACSLFAAGTECVAAACPTSTSENPKDSCDGSGTCVATATKACVSGYLCEAGACHTTCTGDAQCDVGNGFKCTDTHKAAMECKIPQGLTCAKAADCETGFCTDGVCCDHICTHDCVACTTALKGSGKDGFCENVSADTNPRQECVNDGAQCGADGMCDGEGACRSFSTPTTPCGKTQCKGNAVAGSLCDGAGMCAESQVDCAPALCASSACTTTCEKDVDCAAGAFCNLSNKCEDKLTDGMSCAENRECANDHCVDGLCCNKPCAGQCEACAEKGAEGKCVAVQDKPRGDRPACDVAPAAQPCQAVSCNGTDRTACLGYVGSTIVCQDPICKDGLATSTGLCDGAGSCSVGDPMDCGAYRCGDTACLIACKGDADCTGGNRCTQGKCGSGARCSDDLTNVVDADGNATPCAPFLCQGEACLIACSSSTDCADGYVCNGDNQQCEAVAPANTAADSGCGCHVVGRSSPGGFAPLIGLSLLLLRRRRRARAAT